jgi:hypothetical protein
MTNNIEISDIIYYKTYPELAIALMRGDVDYAYIAAFPLFTENLEIVKLAALGPVEYPGIPHLSKNTPDLGVAPKSMFAVPKNMEKYIPELINLINEFLKNPDNVKFVQHQGFNIVDKNMSVKEINIEVKERLSNKLLSYDIKYNY